MKKREEDKRHPVTVTIPKYMLGYVDQIAEDDFMNRSSVISRIIHQHMKEVQKKGEEK